MKKKKKSNLRTVLLLVAAVLIVAIIVGEVLVFRNLIHKISNNTPVPEPPSQEQTEQDPLKPTENLPQPEVVPSQPETKPDEEPEPEPEPEIDSRTIEALTLEYNQDEILLSQTDSLYTLCNAHRLDGARLDLQHLDGNFAALTPKELQRIAVGLVQNYYYVQPKTETVECSEHTLDENGYRVRVRVPATAEVPEMQAIVRMLETPYGFWYAVLLIPQDADVTALEETLNRICLKENE